MSKRARFMSLARFFFTFSFLFIFTCGISHAVLLQSTYLGGNGDDKGQAIAIHPATGDVYIAGTADDQVFVSRLSSDLKTLYHTTYLGGTDRSEAYAIAIHPTTGDVYVTGYTTSTDFPGITNGADTTFAGYNEAFVARLSSDLQTLYQSTFLGGNSYEVVYGFAIHPTTGDVYVVGVTNSTDFPNTVGGADTTIVGDEAFVTRLSNNLQTIYQSTYLGGSKYDSATTIAIHPTTGDIYVAGTTGSSDFPGIAGGADTTFAVSEAFVSRLSSNLQTLYQSTYLGGSDDDSGFGIAIDPTNGIYVTGHTFSNDFPNITGGADTTFTPPPSPSPLEGEGGVGGEAFISKLSSNLQTLYQSTYLGGSDDDVGHAIALHPTTGDVYVTGYTGSADFPGMINAAEPTFAGTEAFAARLSGSLQTLYQSTFLGGRSADTGTGIAIHPTTERIYATGSTGSSDFPKIAGGADTIFSSWTFTTETINTGTEGDDTQIDLGTPDNEFILQYGKGGNDTQYVSGAEGSDWIVQDGGTSNDNQVIRAGSGNDFIYQAGGARDDTQGAYGDTGDDWIYQSGGPANDHITSGGGDGNDYIHQTGGAGNDIMEVDGHEGDDIVIIDGGPGNDMITYNVEEGTDFVFIDGGTGNDILIINRIRQNFALLSMKGEILFQQGTGSTVIWVRSVENITVVGGGPDYEILYEVTDPSDTTGGPDTSYREVGLGEAFVAVFDNLSSLYTLTVTKAGTGSGTVTGPGINCSLDCTEAYDPGTQVTLIAAADSGSTFAGWSGDPDCSDGSMTMTGDKSCIATFNLLQPEYRLTVVKAGTGDGTVTSTGINCGSDCSETYTKIQKVKLTAKANKNSTFGGWSGGNCSGTSPCQVTVDSAITITASFSLKLPDISVDQTPLEFGDVKLKKSLKKTLKISNNGTGDLIVTLSGFVGTEFLVAGKSSITIKPKKSYNLNITFKPTTTGEKAATLMLTTNDLDTGTINIELSGTGI